MREAIFDANAAGDNILLHSSLNGATIDLTLGDIEIPGKSLTIDAHSLSNGITIDAGNGTDNVFGTGDGYRIFNITDVTGGSAPPVVTLIGLTLTGADSSDEGGAIRSQAELAIRDSVITGNAAFSGGAIYQKMAGTGGGTREVLRIDDSLIEDNHSTRDGGGVFVAPFSTSDTTADNIVISGSTFAENVAGMVGSYGSGGGMHATLVGGSALTITNSKFNDNGARLGSHEPGRGGGLFVHSGTLNSTQIETIDISHSEFTDNMANANGGGIYHSAQTAARLSITDTLIAGNHTETSDGGGLFAQFPSGNYSQFADAGVFIHDSRLTGNTARTDSVTEDGDGGGAFVAFAGAHTSTKDLNFVMERTRIESNRATSRGGGLYLFGAAGAKMRIEESVITGNKAGVELPAANPGLLQYNPYSGGGVYAYLFSGSPENARLAIARTTVSGNQAGQHGGGIFICSKRDEPDVSQVAIYNTTISGNTAGYEDNPNTATPDDPITGKGGGVHIAMFQFFPQDEAIEVRFTNVTITENTGTIGGGIYSILPLENTGSINDTWLNNTIVSNNFLHDAPDAEGMNLWGSYNTDESHNNLLGDDVVGHDPDELIWDIFGNDGVFFTGTGENENIFNNDPELDDLAHNGGFSQTHRPLTGSPVIDVGSNGEVELPFDGSAPFDEIDLTTDQRGPGFPRVLDGDGAGGDVVDIGAYEVGGTTKIIDVRIDRRGTNPWADEAEISFAQRVADGEQYVPIFTAGADTIEIHFTKDFPLEDFDSGDFELVGSSGPVTLGTGTYSSSTGIASWPLPSPLPPDKYALVQVGAVNNAGNELDAEWDVAIDINDPMARSPDAPQSGRTFAPGDGVVGSMPEFRLHFAYNPGDYNRDGIVDSTDLLEIKDGDGDGDIEGGVGADDYNVALAAGGAKLPALKWTGDYNDNEVVDIEDYHLWMQKYGSVTELDADGNHDGVVNAADYVIWRNYLAIAPSSAWSEHAGMAADTSGVPIVNFGTAPQVINVTIDGSNTIHDPFSFDSVDGSGAQLIRVPVGGANMIQITFSEDVNISLLDDLTLVGLTTGQLSGEQASYATYFSWSQTAIWYFPNILPNDQYLISLSDNITDVEGNRLDGEWTNPASIFTSSSAGVSTFPSGDGNAGGDFNFVFTLLTDPSGDNVVDLTDDYYIYHQAGFIDIDGDGFFSQSDYYAIYGNMGLDLQDLWILADLNGDYAVDALDLDILADNWLADLQDPTWADGDLNGDGDIDIDDVELFFTQFGLEIAVAA